jgi:hypothetical protein
MCKAYVSKIQSYTECHENHEKVFQAVKKAFTNLKRRITATQPKFDLNFEAEGSEKAEQDSDEEHDGLVLDLEEPETRFQGEVLLRSS